MEALLDLLIDFIFEFKLFFRASKHDLTSDFGIADVEERKSALSVNVLDKLFYKGFAAFALIVYENSFAGLDVA